MSIDIHGVYVDRPTVCRLTYSMSIKIVYVDRLLFPSVISYVCCRPNGSVKGIFIGGRDYFSLKIPFIPINSSLHVYIVYTDETDLACLFLDKDLHFLIFSITYTMYAIHLSN